MKKQSKKSTIANFIVMPLIASAILLASPPVPAMAEGISSSSQTTHNSSMRRMHDGQAMDHKKGVFGTVVSISGNIITVKIVDGTQYTIDASKATIMKASLEPNMNPSVITISNIIVGDTIMVRGTISNQEISATNIFDGKIGSKHQKKFNGRIAHSFKKGQKTG